MHALTAETIVNTLANVYRSICNMIATKAMPNVKAAQQLRGLAIKRQIQITKRRAGDDSGSIEEEEHHRHK